MLETAEANDNSIQEQEQAPEAEALEVAEAVTPEATDEQQADEPAPEPEPEDEVTVAIGEESPPPREEPAPQWVKDLRKSHRELQRRNRELEQRLQAQTSPAPQPVVVGKKPKLEDFDYDEAKFDAALDQWHERKRKADEQQAKFAEEQQRQEETWRQKLDAYSKAKATLRVSDADEAEEVAREVLSLAQQGMVVQAADAPALVIYALGKNPKKARELAAITDPIKFSHAVGKLEKELKVLPKKPAPPPEKIPSGNGRLSGAVDSTLDRLRAEAEKTGNYSKVIAYKNSKRRSG